MSSAGKARNRSRSPVQRNNSERRNNVNTTKVKVENTNSKPRPQHNNQEETKTPKSDQKPIRVVRSERNDTPSTAKDGKASHNSTNRQTTSSASRTYVNPVTGKTERKFSNRCRLFIGNIVDTSEEDFKKMFESFGEYSEVYINKEKAFGFIRMDTRMNAEAVKTALDGSSHKGRSLTVRFASISAAIHVSNLGSLVSNEMLEKAFSTFGDVERAVVVVDDRGRSKGYGVVEFARKSSAINAMQRTDEGFFMIGRSPRPVFTKQQEQTDEEEGLVEKSIERQQGYFKERDAGARFATSGTFEHEWCQKWKALDEMQRNQKEALEKQFLDLGEKLETDMLQAVIDYENELNRRELLAKQEELRRQEEIMRQEIIRQQTLELNLRRHEEARMQEELRRQEEMRIQEELLYRRQHEEILRRRQEEAAILHGGRLPHLPPFGSPLVQPGLFGSSPGGVHPLHPRIPMGPMARGPPPGDARHQGLAYDIEADRARDRAMERGERVRHAPRYDHPPRDRYGDSRKNR